jgi:hypothetical protein
LAAGAIGAKLSSPFSIQDALAHDRARRVAGAEEQYFQGFDRALGLHEVSSAFVACSLSPAASVSNILSQSTARATSRSARRICSSDVINAKAADFGAWQPAASGLKPRPGGSEPNPLADSSKRGSMGEPKMRIFS